MLPAQPQPESASALLSLAGGCATILAVRVALPSLLLRSASNVGVPKSKTRWGPAGRPGSESPRRFAAVDRLAEEMDQEE